MRFWLSPHAVERADQRFGWSPKQATKYWYNHVDWGTFNQGPGVYNVVMGGYVLWTVAYDPEQNQVRCLTMAIAKSFNSSGWLGPLTNEDGEVVSYSTRVESAGPDNT